MGIKEIEGKDQPKALVQIKLFALSYTFLYWVLEMVSGNTF